MGFHSSLLALEFNSLWMGSKLAPAGGRERWAAAIFLHLHLLIAASDCLAISTGVNSEVEFPAEIGGDPAGTADCPIHTLERADQGSGRAIDYPPGLGGGGGNHRPGVAEAGLQVRQREP